MTPRQAKLAYVETAGSITWFLMDASWMLELRTPALALAAPTVLLALVAFAYADRTIASMFVTAAMAAWAAMNVAWMAHDLGAADRGLVLARVFFSAGIACLTVALVASRGAGIESVLRRFRRLRINRR